MSHVVEFLVQTDENFRRARLPALFSDFSAQKTLSPDFYHANAHAWRRALSRAAWEGKLANETISDLLLVRVNKGLLRTLEYKQFGQPLGLGSAVRDAIAEREFISIDEFLNAKESIYHKGWTALPRSMVSWAVRKVWSSESTTGDDTLPEGTYVSMKNVEEAAGLISDRIAVLNSPFERTFTKAHFQKTFACIAGDRKLTARDIDVLLLFLSRDRPILSYDGKTVRIRGTSGTEAPNITQDDTAIASLKELIADLQQQTSTMEARVGQLEEKARDAVARKSRVTALAALKSKKLLETALAQRHATLSQLETVASKIEQATDHVQMLRVMEASTSVLQSLNQQVGGVEHVDDVIEKLREQMGEVDEVGDAIANSQTIDETEIDDELAEMERQEKIAEEQTGEESERVRKARQEAKEAEETAKRLEAIPAVPSSAESPAQETGTLTPATEAAETMGRLSLEGPRREGKQLATS